MFTRFVLNFCSPLMDNVAHMPCTSWIFRWGENYSENIIDLSSWFCFVWFCLLKYTLIHSEGRLTVRTKEQCSHMFVLSPVSEAFCLCQNLEDKVIVIYHGLLLDIPALSFRPINKILTLLIKKKKFLHVQIFLHSVIFFFTSILFFTNFWELYQYLVTQLLYM